MRRRAARRAARRSVFSAVRIVFSATRIVFSATRIVFSATRIAFPAARIVFSAARIVFSAARIVFSAARIALYRCSGPFRPGQLYASLVVICVVVCVWGGGGEGGREGAGSALSQPLMIFVYQTDPAVRLARIPLLHLNLAAGAQATQAGAVVCHLQLQALLRQRRSAGVSGRDHGGGAQGGGGLLPGQRVGPGPGGAAVPRAHGRVHRVGGRPSRAARRRRLRRPEVSPHPAPARGPNRARRSVPLRGRRAAPPAVRLGPGPPRLAVDRAPVFDTSLGERGARELRLFATASRGLLATGGAALDPPRENSRLKSNEALCEGLTRFSNPPSGTPRERARGSRRRG